MLRNAAQVAMLNGRGGRGKIGRALKSALGPQLRNCNEISRFAVRDARRSHRFASASGAFSVTRPTKPDRLLRRDSVEELLKTWSTRVCGGHKPITQARSVEQRPFYEVEFCRCACSAPEPFSGGLQRGNCGSREMYRTASGITVVPGEGIEPSLCRQNWILSPARLPIPPSRLSRRGTVWLPARDGAGIIP
jgi:hypothetical protein